MLLRSMREWRSASSAHLLAHARIAGEHVRVCTRSIAAASTVDMEPSCIGRNLTGGNVGAVATRFAKAATVAA
jgi:hypothetical protein